MPADIINVKVCLSHLILKVFSRTSFLRWLKKCLISSFKLFMFCLYLPVLVLESSIILHSLDVFKFLFLFGFYFSRTSCLISSQKTGLLSVFIIIILLYSHSSFVSFFLNSLNQNSVFYSRWTCALFDNNRTSHSPWKEVHASFLELPWSFMLFCYSSFVILKFFLLPPRMPSTS